MKSSEIPPRIVAQIAIENIRRDVKNGVVHNWTHNLVGRIGACASITQDWEIIGWNNEAWFLTGDYTNRHDLRW